MHRTITMHVHPRHKRTNIIAIVQRYILTNALIQMSIYRLHLHLCLIWLLFPGLIAICHCLTYLRLDSRDGHEMSKFETEMWPRPVPPRLPIYMTSGMVKHYSLNLVVFLSGFSSQSARHSTSMPPTDCSLFTAVQNQAMPHGGTPLNFKVRTFSSK